VYAQLIDKADRLEITHIRDEIDGDTNFPLIDPAVWREVGREERGGFDWVSYAR